MIQRKQSVFLALAALFLVLLFIFPIYSFEKDGEQSLFYIFGVNELNTDFFLLITLNVLNIFLLITIIFIFKNRMLQIKLCRLSTLLIAGFVVAIFYFAESVKSYEELIGYATSMMPVLVSPLAALVLVILASRAIKKDEELVRSADRLR